MRIPSKDSIKDTKGNFHVVRYSAYRGGVSEKVEWLVCERINDNTWRLVREFNTKRDAIHFLHVAT